MKQLTQEALLRPWIEMPRRLAYYAAIGVLGTAVLTALHVKFPASPDTVPGQAKPSEIPIIIPAPSPGRPAEPVEMGKLVADLGFGTTDVFPIRNVKRFAASEWLYKDVVDASMSKIGSVDDFVFAKDGKVDRVILSLRTENSDWKGSKYSVSFANFLDLETNSSRVVMVSPSKAWIPDTEACKADNSCAYIYPTNSIHPNN